MDKILFICEGAKTEKKFCNLIIDKYFLKQNRVKEYVAFGTNLYGLYDEMSKDDGLDIIELIKEKAKEKKDMYNYNKLVNGGFSEVYLIFDFDFQAPQYDCQKISEMINFFDNETEHGKLYINYPMIESFKHFKSIPDSDYNSYEVTKEECLTYKKYVALNSIIKHFNDIDEKILKIIIKQNIDKYGYIVNFKLDTYNSYMINFSQKMLLDFQIKHINKNNKIYVFNTSVFWGIDYFGMEKFNDCINIDI